jgi:hypothetical protein
LQKERDVSAMPKQGEVNPVWMLHCACAPFSMTSVVSFRALFFVIPSESEESSAMWMLHFAYAQRSVQHDKCGVIPNALFCHSERMRGIQYGCFASLSMTSAVSFQVLFFLSFRARARNPVRCGCFTSLSMTSAVSFRTQ